MAFQLASLSSLVLVLLLIHSTLSVDDDSNNIKAYIDFKQEYHNLLQIIENNTVTSKASLSIEKIPSSKEFKYIQVFNDAIIKNIPIQSSFKHENKILQSELDSCFDISASKVLTSDFYESSLSNCKSNSVYEKTIIPSIVTNNYLFRVNQKKIDIPHIIEWPSLIKIKVGIPTVVQKCPFNLHHFIYIVSPSSSSTSTSPSLSLKVRLFSSSTASEFEPMFNIKQSTTNTKENSQATAAGTNSNNIFQSHLFQKTGYPKISSASSNNNNDGESNGGNKITMKRFSLPKFVEVILNSKSNNGNINIDNSTDYLFIPHTHLASFLFEGGTSATTDNSDNNNNQYGYICRICVLDASNYQDFIKLLTLAVHVSEQQKQQEISSSSSSSVTLHTQHQVNLLSSSGTSSMNNNPYAALLHQLQSVTSPLSLAMNPTPVDMTVKDIMNKYQRKPTAATSAITTSGTAGLTDEEREDEIVNQYENDDDFDDNIDVDNDSIADTSTTASFTTSTTTTTTAADRAKNFKAWQEKQKWDMFITSLTTPTPSQPVVRSVGRLNITLEWNSGSSSSLRSQFLPAFQDTTAFGFRIDVCALANDRLLSLPSSSSSPSSTDDKKIIGLGNRDSSNGNNNKDIRLADLTNILLEGNHINNPTKLTTTTINTAKTVTVLSKFDSNTDSNNINDNNIPINTVCRNITTLRPSINLDTTPQSLITTDKLIEYTQQSSSINKNKKSRFKMMNEDNSNSITTFSVVLGNEVNIQPNSIYVTRVTTVYNEYNSTPSHWSPLILTQPLTVPSHFPTLEFIREKVAVAFQLQKERYQTDHMTAVKRKAEEEGIDINAVKLTKKRLPRPLLVNCSVEASLIYTDGLGNINNNNNNNFNHNVGILGTSIYLSFLKPIDDGGLNILGYQVYGRPVSCSDALTAGSRFSGGSGGNNKSDIDLLCGFSSSSSSSLSSTTTATSATASHKKLVEHLPKIWIQFDASSIIPSAAVTATTVSTLYKAKSNIAEQLPTSSLDVVTVQVNNLHLDTFYEFKVCAFNSLGCGPFSQYSNIFKTHSHNSGSGSTINGSGGGQGDGRRVNIILGQNYSLSLSSLSLSTTSPSVTSISAQAPSQQQRQQLLNNKWMIVNMNDQSLSLLDTAVLSSTTSLRQLQQSQNMHQIRIELMKAALYRIDGWKCHWSSASLATVAPLTLVGEVKIPTTNIIYSTSSSSDSIVTDLKTLNTDVTTSTMVLNNKEINSNNINNNINNYNNSTVFGKIAVVQRGGGVPIVHKVHAAQRAGAVGVVIVDNGACKKFDQACMPGSDKSQGLGFAAHDIQQPWSFVRVPVFFVLASDFQTLITSSGLHDVLLASGSNNSGDNHIDTSAAQIINRSDEL